jgi:hypothetical protein
MASFDGLPRQVRLLFEFLPTGGIVPLPTLNVFRPLLYDMPNDYIRAGFEVAYVFYTLYFVLQVWWRPSAPECTRVHPSAPECA